MSRSSISSVLSASPPSSSPHSPSPSPSLLPSPSPSPPTSSSLPLETGFHRVSTGGNSLPTRLPSMIPSHQNISHRTPESQQYSYASDVRDISHYPLSSVYARRSSSPSIGSNHSGSTHSGGSGGHQSDSAFERDTSRVHLMDHPFPKRPKKKRRKATNGMGSSRPPNAFILFSQEMRKEIRKDNPGVRNGEISKLLGLEWKKLDQVIRLG